MAQDISSVRDLVNDEKIVVCMARVALHDGETSHHYVTEEGHVAITVKTHKHGVPVDAVLPGGADAGTGPWWIPEIGTEVMIGFDGDFEDDAFVLNIYGSKPPTQMAEGKLVMVGTEIHAIAPNGTAASLATKADLQATTDYLHRQFHSTDGHQHVTLIGTTPVSTVSLSEGAGPIVGPGVDGSAPNPDGTEVLKGQ